MTIRNTGLAPIKDFLDHITLDLTNPLVPAIRCERCQALEVVEVRLPPTDVKTRQWDRNQGRRIEDPAATVIRFVEAMETFQENHRECEP